MRTYTVEDSEPVTSAERAKTPSVVPPFSFIGQATMGLSGYWSPPHSLMLWNGYVTSAEFGSSEGGWVIMKEEPFNPTSVYLCCLICLYMQASGRLRLIRHFRVVVRI